LAARWRASDGQQFAERLCDAACPGTPPTVALKAISVKSHTVSLVLSPAFGVTPAVT
jgi:hypothetical protein